MEHKKRKSTVNVDILNPHIVQGPTEQTNPVKKYSIKYKFKS